MNRFTVVGIGVAVVVVAVGLGPVGPLAAASGGTHRAHTHVPPATRLVAVKNGVAVPPSERIRTTMHLGQGVTVRPPRIEPTISERVARDDLFAQGFTRLNGTGKPPELRYGILSDSVMRTITASQLPAGLSLPPGDPAAAAPQKSGLLYQNVPVWVVIYTGVATTANGGQLPPGVTTTTESASTLAKQIANSVQYEFENADTGQYFMGIG